MKRRFNGEGNIRKRSEHSWEASVAIEGGERIFSRKSSRVIIRKAKKAYKNRKNEKFDNYCRSLGKYVFKELDAQDSRDAEYVSLDNNKDNG